MPHDLGFTCSCCGDHHADVPLGYSTMAPDVWDPSFETDPDSMLSSDQCIITGQHFFIKGLIEIPVIGSEDVFSWGVWVSLSRDNFTRALEVWKTEGRETEKPVLRLAQHRTRALLPGDHQPEDERPHPTGRHAPLHRAGAH